MKTASIPGLLCAETKSHPPLTLEFVSCPGFEDKSLSQSEEDDARSNINPVLVGRCLKIRVLCRVRDRADDDQIHTARMASPHLRQSTAYVCVFRVSMPNAYGIPMAGDATAAASKRASYCVSALLAKAVSHATGFEQIQRLLKSS